jgi:hypothetical protein
MGTTATGLRNRNCNGNGATATATAIAMALGQEQLGQWGKGAPTATAFPLRSIDRVCVCVEVGRVRAPMIDLFRPFIRKS